MTILLLMSTMSFTVEKHFCGNHLVDVAVFSEVKKCGMQMASDTEKSVNNGCCKDEVEVVEGQDDLKSNSIESLDFNEQFLVTSFLFTYKNLFESLPKQIIPHKDYSPPNLIEDIQVLDQVFLI
ncbi:hypothetical protein [uncultured Psychroserpens sp.]|uniref:HYC_CC_PP family protein n=1 Tax=uncultured Psychroserpens sp. TaxID=255436 RepID=UPI0026043689|nr:hypothetical protein [uncultured Psychroserpens sp.]